MATHTFHDPDGGIGFDMRNAHLYHDSDDEDEIEERHRPRPYTPKSESGCNCCFILVILIILIAGSIIGYSLGSSFTAPQPYEAATNPPKPTSSNTYVRHTPSPHVRKDPFHNHGKGQKGGITSVFTQNTPKPTPQSISTLPEPPPQDNADTTPVVDKPAFEPSAAVEKPAFEPSAAIEKPAFEPSAAVQKPAFEPSAVEKPAFEPSAAVQKPAVEKPSNPKQIENDVDLGDIISDLERKNKLKLIHTALALDDEYDLGDSAILSKLVLDGREITHIFEHAQKFTVQYPANGKSYDINEYKTWCFHFYLYDYPAAQIDIKFNAFQLERGFDRVLIRHFNQSFLDPPVVYAGRGAFDAAKFPWILPEPVTYHLRRNEFKSVCVELESDDSVGLNGVSFDVSVGYDGCQWSEYSECRIVDESKKHWDRGPFYDGSCGIGIRQRHRIANGSCDHMRDGPEYCLKAPCETVDNQKKGIPGDIRYGWANPNTFYNGIGTFDAPYPDLLRILTANPSTPATFASANAVKEYLSSPSFVSLYQSYPIYDVNPKGHAFDLGSIMNALEEKRKEILSEHVDERALTLPVLELKHINQTMEWLGARLSHSLLIGRPFTMVFTGSSNTAGHDNQFASSYPMQLQSRLRTFWARIGVDGAAMNVRNVAVGGTPKTDTMAWHVAARSSENPSYPYNAAKDTYDGLWRNEDVIFWGRLMSDGGRPPNLATEQQLRLTALLNAIFGAMTSINSVKTEECNAHKTWKSARPPAYINIAKREPLFGHLTSHYDQHMGIIQMDFETFVNVVCSNPKYKTLKINWHPNAGGHRCEADIYAYMLLGAALNFMKTNQQTIEKHQGNPDVKALDAWLLEKSGNWSEKYIKSIQNKDTNLFPAAMHCQPFCDHTVAPFALKTVEPNEWDVAYRLTDYIVYDYDTMDNNTTAGNTVEGVHNDLVPDRKSRFCVEQLLRSNGWSYLNVVDSPQHFPQHFPQDRTGKIGAMDRKRHVGIHQEIWFVRFREFLQENHTDELDVFSLINHANGKKRAQARKVFGKYVIEWGDYVLQNDYDVKIAFLVPEIGNHSILAFTDEGEKDWFGKNGAKKGAIGINLERMDRRNNVNVKYEYKYDFNKRLTEQRKCTEYKYQRGCVFHDIPPGKYIMRFYPIDLTKQSIPGLVQVIAF
eukprot:929762_1